MIMELSCTHRNYHSLGLLALPPLVADLARADIAAAATVAAATEDNDRDDGTETDDRPGRITLILSCLTIHLHHERIS